MEETSADRVEAADNFDHERAIDVWPVLEYTHMVEMQREPRYCAGAGSAGGR